MKLLKSAFLISTTLLFAGIASATPITFSLDSVTVVGSALPATQTYTPPLPIVGSGNIDFGLGTGSVSLPDYSVTLDIGSDTFLDAKIDTTGWSQTITSIDLSGNVTSTGAGTNSCTDLGGGFGGIVCAIFAPTVAGWPPPGATSSAILDTFAQTLVVTDTSDPNAGTVTQYYSYTVVPEPGTALLMGLGLFGLGLRERRGGA
jgi:hypothetical protein